MRDILIGCFRALRGLARSIDTAHAIRHGVHTPALSTPRPRV